MFLGHTHSYTITGTVVVLRCPISFQFLFPGLWVYWFYCSLCLIPTAVHTFASRVLMSFSVDETQLPRYVNLSSSFRKPPFRVEMSLLWLKHNTQQVKTWRAIDRLSVIWKSDLSDKIKRSFFQEVIVSILLYGCTTWRQLHEVVTRYNKSWKQHPIKQ